MKRQKIGSVKGGKSKSTYPVHWDSDTKKVYVEKFGFWGSTLIDTKTIASSAEAAMNVAEAFVYDK